VKKYPLCRICHNPMMVGQTDTHYVCVKDPIGNLERGLELSQGSADAKWDTRQAAAVDQAIRNAAAKKTFITADDIWAELPATFPVGKGLAARLLAASRAGVIENTGTTTTARRGGAHDHAQRLTIWRSLMEGRNPAMTLDRGARR
jgi:hypothetical protein